METYKEITTKKLLSLIADKDTANVFYKNGGNLNPVNSVEFSFKELHIRKFYLREIKEEK